MTGYTHKQPALPSPTPPKKRGKFWRKAFIILLAAGLGSAYHKFNQADSLAFLKSHGSLYETFQKTKPQTPAENTRKPTATTKQNKTPLHTAASNGLVNAARKLIANGAWVGQLDANKRTPLHLAAANNKLFMITFLIKSGANINAIDKDGNTPVMLAAMRKNQEAVFLLLDNGANHEIINKAGKNPLVEFLP